MDDKENMPDQQTEAYLQRQQQSLLQETSDWLKTRGPTLNTLLETIIGETDDAHGAGPGSRGAKS